VRGSRLLAADRRNNDVLLPLEQCCCPEVYIVLYGDSARVVPVYTVSLGISVKTEPSGLVHAHV
jgi:hypothetical protein